MEPLNNTNQVKMLLLMLFNSVFVLVFSYILFNIVINPNNYFIEMNGWIISIGSLMLLGILILIDRGIKQIREKKYLLLISILNLSIIIGLQWFFFKYFKVTPTWDFGHVYDSALQLKDEFTYVQPYFYVQFPNNIPVLLLFVGIMRFLDFIGIHDYLPCFIIINMLVVILSIVCLYVFIYRRTTLSHITTLSFLLVIITPLYTYTTIVYTDTLTMIFPILSLLMYDFFYHSEDRKFKYVWLVFLGICLAIGTLIKANVIITLIAILIHYFMTTKWKSSLIFMVVLLIPFISTNYVYQKVIDPIIPVEDEELGYPTTHWLMMGLNHSGKIYGGFNIGDVHITAELKKDGLSNNDITKQHIKIIKERLSNYGVQGYLEFLSKKINFTWGEGTYYAPDKLIRSPLGENKYQQYVFGDKQTTFVYGSQISHTLILFLIVIAGCSLFRQRISFEVVLSITLFGVFLFLLFWETRSRYLVLYIPVMLALASHGLYKINCKINK